MWLSRGVVWYIFLGFIVYCVCHLFGAGDVCVVAILYFFGGEKDIFYVVRLFRGVQYYFPVECVWRGIIGHTHICG